MSRFRETVYGLFGYRLGRVDLAWFACILLASMGGYSFVAGASHLFSGRDRFSEVTRFDLPRGTQVALPKFDVNGRSLLTGKNLLLVFLGPCQSCSLNSLDPDKLRAAIGILPVFVVRASADEIDPSMRQRKESLLLADEGRQLESELNIGFLPRMVLLDSTHRIKWQQPAPGQYLEGVTYVESEAQSRTHSSRTAHRDRSYRDHICLQLSDRAGGMPIR